MFEYILHIHYQGRFGNDPAITTSNMVYEGGGIDWIIPKKDGNSVIEVEGTDEDIAHLVDVIMLKYLEGKDIFSKPSHKKQMLATGTII